MSGFKRRKPYQGVTAYVGMPGSGKTYTLARIGLDALRAGERVVTNEGFEIVDPVSGRRSEVFSSFDEFAALQGPVVVCWDELPLYFNARKWAEFGDGMLYKFTQIRKDGIRLHYSAIHELMVDVTLRRITFWYWHCRPVVAGWHRREMWPPEEFRKATQRPLMTSWFRIREEVASSYDTDAKVAVSSKLRAALAEGHGAAGKFALPEGVPPARSAAVVPLREDQHPESSEADSMWLTR